MNPDKSGYLKSVAAGFAAIGSEPRLNVLLTLVRAGDEGLLFGALQKKTDIPAATLSHHLRLLLDTGLVTKTKQGREAILRAEHENLRALSNYILDQCCADQDVGPCLHALPKHPADMPVEPNYDVIEPVEDLA